MSRRIVGVTVGTTISPKAMERRLNPVKSVNGVKPDESGNVNVEVNAGADGYSPVAKVTQTDTGAVISITDQSGTTTATVVNGKDGEKGDKGDAGDDGVYVLADGETIEDAPEDAKIIIDPNEEIPDDGGTEVYILSDGETTEDAPEDAKIIIDPNEKTPDYVQTVNGVKPDVKGNVNVQGNFTEEDKAEIVSAVLDALPVYDGEYEVTPSVAEEVTLLTRQKYVDADVKIAKIPYYEVSNNSGGTTANIGG